MDTTPPAKASKPSFSTQFLAIKGRNFSPFLILGFISVLLGGGLFFHFDANKSEAAQEISTLQSELLALKNAFEFSESAWGSEREDLYEIIDEMEVSIHSLLLKAPLQATKSKLVTIPHEAELRLWRYLGLTQMADVEQAIFHTGKGAQMINKAGLTLGEWRLSQVEKELAILTHPQGKSITFKSTQSE
jgi:hypothetical protein